MHDRQASSLALSLSPMGVILPLFASAQSEVSVDQAYAGKAADAGISGDGHRFGFPNKTGAGRMYCRVALMPE
jgi:hypothetical protein